ncbi:hypothetical protein EST38_g13412 [Candolleomyces aberdarensis]|uniref:Uncharacterized protein n=1 Tax=Candolleomyces aberdarensis TaxID=2316362 RepID=A0A4Q2D001_9AGAR|nr:hypothetical protein EST38_g13412 [Candolleomyces aberdarensis]
MSQKENVPPAGTKRKARSDDSSGDVFACGPRKQSKTDPLVGFGRHFGRTIRSFCRIQPLIKNGMTRTMQLELERITEADLSPSELKEHDIYVQLLALSPGLEEKLCTGSDQEIFYVADMITKGASGASGHHYNPEKPWEGLFRGKLLVSAYKHVFTSPSSVDGNESRATRSCNARIHGMKTVTIPSIAYIATQVRFALSSTPTFSRSDTMTDSEYFYTLVIELLEDPEERVEVDELLKWWNMQNFPTYISENRAVHHDSVIFRIKEKRRHLKLQEEREGSSGEGNPASCVDNSN